MVCQTCGKETEEGRFCAHCGAQLTADESAAATQPLGESEPSPVQESHEMETRVESDTSDDNEFVEKTKEIAANFGQLFVDQIKSPMNSKQVNSTHLISGIITIVIFALVMAINSYMSYKSFAYIGEAVFVDGFLIPFLQQLLLFGIVASLVFGATKLCNLSFSYSDIVAKYGAYAVPFLLLYVVGFLFSLVDLVSLSIITITVSLFGSILIIPTIIVLEQKSRSLDQLYVIIGMSIISLIAFGYLTSSYIGMLDGITAF